MSLMTVAGAATPSRSTTTYGEVLGAAALATGASANANAPANPSDHAVARSIMPPPRRRPTAGQEARNARAPRGHTARPAAEGRDRTPAPARSPLRRGVLAQPPSPRLRP